MTEGIEIKEGMSDAERVALLRRFREKCSEALDDPNTPTDDFFTAMMGWALLTDKLAELGVSRDELYRSPV